ncbi:arabinosyltransferase domain-containing protein [Modestobacter sp. I12A-02662]|uniref:arabinosyltransferase domain-containing protein n=1 Tax=Modestobacter sp. I12A-02662 TaxID=1730496 RepID=UPI0034E02823
MQHEATPVSTGHPGRDDDQRGPVAGGGAARTGTAEEAVPDTPPSPAGAPRDEPSARGRTASWWGPLVAFLAVVAAVLLPLAPVEMSTPVVTWPEVPGQPASTMLMLTSQEPVTLDVEVSCGALRAAAGTPDGVVLSTIRPGAAVAGTEGLLITAGGGVLRIESMDRVLLEEPVPAGACTYALHGDGSGLEVSRDGEVVGRARATALPGIDVLATSLGSLSAADGEELSVRIGVDDQFATSPTGLKVGLVAVCLGGAVLALVWLRRAGTRSRRRRGWGAAFWLRRGVDLVVVAVLLLWTLLTPMTGDDGYYAAMARNAPLEGYVGNYFQLLNQSFTPFTWFYRLLGWWQQVAGDAPAALRVPALLAGLGTYVLAARLVAVAPWRGQWTRLGGHALLALVFLVWWMPYDMGIRPEAVVALAGAGTLLAVVTAVRRRSLFWCGVAVLVAAVGFVCHPTGFVTLAPLVAGLPSMARLVRTGRLPATLGRVVAIVAPGAVASVLAFGDGTLRDFIRGQEIFLAAQPQEDWTREYARYTMLLGQDFMGAYAKRLPVLIAIVALVGWLVLAAALRGRGRPLPALLHLSAVSLGLSLLLLWLTPSKWSFHFGSLVGVGSVFVTLFLCGLVRASRQVHARGSLPVPTVLFAALAVVLTVALSFAGPNAWPSSWMLGVPQANVPPSLGVPLESPLPWLAGLVVVAAVLWWRARRRGGGSAWPVAVTRSLPVVLTVALAVGGTYLVGTFAYAALAEQESWTPWGDTLQDPLARNCHASGAFEVLTDEGRPLDEQSAGDVGVFTEGAGWYAPVPPAGSAGRIWGSLLPPAFNGVTGTAVTGWYSLPELDPGREAVALTAAGNLGAGNALVAEYGRTTPGGVQVVASEELGDEQSTPYWRTATLDPEVSGEAGADAVRLVAVDSTTDVGGWLAFSEPMLREWVSVESHLGGDQPVAVAWQIALLFPCQQQPRVQYGITEPVQDGILYGGSMGAQLGDATWLVDRGGLYAPVPREASVTALPTRLPGAPQVQDVGVYLFEYPYPEGRYELTPETTTTRGWAPPPGWGNRPAR